MTTTYNNTKVLFPNADLDVSSDTLRVALVSDNTAYTPDIDNEAFVSDVFDATPTAEEFGDNGGTGYGRQTLANVSVTQDNTDDEAVVDADDTTFPSIDGETVQGVLLYKQVGGDDTTPGDDPLVGYFDGGDYPVAANGSDFTVEWASEGLLNVT